jgi:hypothetical protein
MPAVRAARGSTTRRNWVRSGRQGSVCVRRWRWVYCWRRVWCWRRVCCWCAARGLGRRRCCVGRGCRCRWRPRRCLRRRTRGLRRGSGRGWRRLRVARCVPIQPLFPQLPGLPADFLYPLLALCIFRVLFKHGERCCEPRRCVCLWRVAEPVRRRRLALKRARPRRSYLRTGKPVGERLLVAPERRQREAAVRQERRAQLHGADGIQARRVLRERAQVVAGLLCRIARRKRLRRLPALVVQLWRHRPAPRPGVSRASLPFVARLAVTTLLWTWSR